MSTSSDFAGCRRWRGAGRRAISDGGRTRTSSAAVSPPLVRHAGGSQAQLHAGERAHQHQVVEVAEVADAEHLARSLPSPVPSDMSKRSRMILRKRVRVVPIRHQHRGERVEYSAGSAHSISRPQPRTARARRLGVPRVAREDVGQALLLQHRERLAQAVEQIGRRRVGEEALALGFSISCQSQYDSRQPRGLRARRAPSRDTALKPRPGGSISPSASRRR